MQLLAKPDLQKMTNDNRVLLHLGSVVLAPRISRRRICQDNQKLLKLAPRRLLDAAIHEKGSQINAAIIPRLLIPTFYLRGVHKEPNVES